MEAPTSDVLDHGCTPAPGTEPCLYHERQVASLCGVHTINTLLQGPFVTEIDLATIAQDLDAMERAFMSESGIQNEDYLQFMAEESNNVAADGMFSIQVLSKALEVWGLTAIPLNNPAMRGVAQEPDAEHAFICNCNEHWFTVRKVGNEWWNFNSMLPAPAPLSAFYLAAFLTTLQEQGYTLFVVRGNMLPAQLANVSDLPQQGQYFTPEQARSITKSASEARTTGNRHLTNADTSAIKDIPSAFTGIGRTLRDTPPSPHNVHHNHNGHNEDEDLQRAIAASLQQQQQVGSSHPDAAAVMPTTSATTSAQQQSNGDDAHAQPAHAQPASSVEQLAEQPIPPRNTPPPHPADSASPSHASPSTSTSAGQGPSAADPPCDGDHTASSIPPDASIPSTSSTLQLAIRMPEGERIVREFSHTVTVGDVYAMLPAACKDRAAYDLLRQYPRTVLRDDTLTLIEAGVLDKDTLMFQSKS